MISVRGFRMNEPADASAAREGAALMAKPPLPQTRAPTVLHRFFTDRCGNFAVLAALFMLPLVLAVGFAIDGSRYYKARAHLQDAVDTAALAVAASGEQDTTRLRGQAEEFILANLASNTIEEVEIAGFSSDAEQIDVQASGLIHTTFMRLANVETMPVAASTLAMRAPVRNVEIAMVLDNTYSMIEADAAGKTKIASLKEASTNLVNSLLKEGDEEGSFSISLVPYADHVNVGIGNKNATWLKLNGEERTESGGGDRSCTVTGTETYCKRYPQKTCTETRDGIFIREYSCNDTSKPCLESATRDKQTCTGSNPWTNVYKFYGCVGTRTSGSLRLSDDSPTSKYPAYVETRQNCATPITPLTKNKTEVLTAIGKMSHQPSNYVANTHIPSGLIWGLNVLSHTEPFTEGRDYDAENRDPQKAIILMTDGENTLKYNSAGKHVGLAGRTDIINGEPVHDDVRTADVAKVNNDVLSICTNAKNKKIEIYTIAFMVDDLAAKNMLYNCATSPSHHFDASNSTALIDAFDGIARSMSQVRLAR